MFLIDVANHDTAAKCGKRREQVFSKSSQNADVRKHCLSRKEIAIVISGSTRGQETRKKGVNSRKSPWWPQQQQQQPGAREVAGKIITHAVASPLCAVWSTQRAQEETSCASVRAHLQARLQLRLTRAFNARLCARYACTVPRPPRSGRPGTIAFCGRGKAYLHTRSIIQFARRTRALYASAPSHRRARLLLALTPPLRFAAWWKTHFYLSSRYYAFRRFRVTFLPAAPHVSKTWHRAFSRVDIGRPQADNRSHLIALRDTVLHKIFYARPTWRKYFLFYFFQHELFGTDVRPGYRERLDAYTTPPRLDEPADSRTWNRITLDPKNFPHL